MRLWVETKQSTTIGFDEKKFSANLTNAEFTVLFLRKLVFLDFIVSTLSIAASNLISRLLRGKTPSIVFEHCSPLPHPPSRPIMFNMIQPKISPTACPQEAPIQSPIPKLICHDIIIDYYKESS